MQELHPQNHNIESIFITKDPTKMSILKFINANVLHVLVMVKPLKCIDYCILDFSYMLKKH